jgi:hypothetical protein
MAGKPGRSGRRRQITLEEFRAGKRPEPLSWPLAGHNLKVLIEMWLAGVPLDLGDRCLIPPTERRYTVPPKIKRMLADFAINQAQMVHPGRHIEVEEVLAWARRRGPDNTLRRQARRNQPSASPPPVEPLVVLRFGSTRLMMRGLTLTGFYRPAAPPPF